MSKSSKSLSSSYLTSQGEVLSPGLVKRPRVYANLDYKNSRVQQHFKDECDINKIVHRFRSNGVVPRLIERDPSFGDFTDVPTFQDSLHIVIKAQAQFDALPAEVRKRFSNDPQEFLSFVSIPENRPELVKLGFATEPVVPPTPEPQKVVIVNPDPSKDK